MDGCGTTPGMEEVERRPEQPSRTASGTSGREAAPAHPATAPALLYLRHPCRRLRSRHSHIHVQHNAEAVAEQIQAIAMDGMFASNVEATAGDCPQHEDSSSSTTMRHCVR